MKLHYARLELLRIEVDALVDLGAVDINWGHIAKRKHEVSDLDVYACLLDGHYAEHDTVPDRYISRLLRRDGTAVTVYFEVHEGPDGRRVWVETAF